MAIYRAWVLALLDGDVARTDTVLLWHPQMEGRDAVMVSTRFRLWGATLCGKVRSTNGPNNGVVRMSFIIHIIVSTFAACAFHFPFITLLSVIAAVLASWVAKGASPVHGGIRNYGCRRDVGGWLILAPFCLGHDPVL